MSPSVQFFIIISLFVTGMTIFSSAKVAASQWEQTSYNFNELLKKREPLAREKLWDPNVQVYFFGEWHEVSPAKDESIRQLINFKKHGKITHLAFEMLEASAQPELDRPVSQRRILNEQFYDWDFIPGKYMELAEAAIQNKIKIVGLDTPLHLGQMEEQNIFWANVIQNILKKEPKAKIMVYCGVNHAGVFPPGKTADRILNEMGVRTKVVHLAGGLKMEISDRSNNISQRVAQAAEKMGLEKTFFGLDVSDTKNEFGVDYVVHVPEEPAPQP